MIKKKIFFLLILALFGLVWAVQAAEWEPPKGNFPSGNPPDFLTVTDLSQSKLGNLFLGNDDSGLDIFKNNKSRSFLRFRNSARSITIGIDQGTRSKPECSFGIFLNTFFQPFNIQDRNCYNPIWETVGNFIFTTYRVGVGTENPQGAFDVRGDEVHFKGVDERSLNNVIVRGNARVLGNGSIVNAKVLKLMGGDLLTDSSNNLFIDFEDGTIDPLVQELSGICVLSCPREWIIDIDETDNNNRSVYVSLGSSEASRLLAYRFSVDAQGGIVSFNYKMAGTGILSLSVNNLTSRNVYGVNKSRDTGDKWETLQANLSFGENVLYVLGQAQQSGGLEILIDNFRITNMKKNSLVVGGDVESREVADVKAVSFSDNTAQTTANSTMVVCRNVRRQTGSRTDTTAYCDRNQFLVGGGCFINEIEDDGDDNVGFRPVDRSNDSLSTGDSTLGAGYRCNNDGYDSDDKDTAWALCCGAYPDKNLYLNQHSFRECIDAGGIPSEVDNVWVCKIPPPDPFSVPSPDQNYFCPANWTPYGGGNYTETDQNYCRGKYINKICDRVIRTTGSCRTRSHSLSTDPIESCAYTYFNDEDDDCDDTRTCKAFLANVACY